MKRALGILMVAVLLLCPVLAVAQGLVTSVVETSAVEWGTFGELVYYDPGSTWGLSGLVGVSATITDNTYFVAFGADNLRDPLDLSVDFIADLAFDIGIPFTMDARLNTVLDLSDPTVEIFNLDSFMLGAGLAFDSFDVAVSSEIKFVSGFFTVPWIEIGVWFGDTP